MRPIACITGPAFHVLVEVLDLKIGWFSYYMMAVYYILLFPDTWFLFVARPFTWAHAKTRPIWTALGGLKLSLSPTVVGLLAVVTGTLCAVFAAGLPVEGALGIAAATGVLAAIGTWRSSGPGRAALIQLCAAAAMLFSLMGSDAAYDYYRFWAGDNARRGNVRRAVGLYEKANALKPDDTARRAKLARLYRKLGQVEDAERVEAELKAITSGE